jgi:arabinogalactan oligomer/maltooligosaccharide transport system permease protein
MSTVTLVEREDILTRENLTYLLVAPGLFVFLAFLIYPMAYLLYLSFTNAEPATLFTGSEQWVGLANYLRILSDGQFWNSLGITWLYVLTSTVGKLVFGLAVSVLLTSGYVVGRRWYRGIVILPMGLPAIVAISVWRGIFSSANFGLANQLLSFFGISPVPWLSQRWFAFLSYNITHAWLAYPFILLITVSALQNVPDSLHDAAKVDGAGFLARFVHVTLPAIKGPLLFATIYTSAASFQEFLLPFVFNEGGPARANELILVYGFREAFRFDRYGRGSAIMVVALMFIGAFMYTAAKRGGLADRGGPA